MAIPLPFEILRSIFTALREDAGLPAVIPCTTVCKTWSRPAVSAIWADVVVTETTLPKIISLFSDFEDGEQGREKVYDFPKATRSLTVLIMVADIKEAQGNSSTVDSEVDSSVADNMRENLLRLSMVIQRSFTSISTFSLNCSRASRRPNNRSQSGAELDLPRQTIISLLEALPKSCVNVEIDTNAWELARIGCGDFEAHHLCTAIRALLPRLQHLRLRLASVCSDILCEPSNPNDADHTGRDFVVAPHLKSLCISMQPRDRLCGRPFLAFSCALARSLIADAHPDFRGAPSWGSDTFPIPDRLLNTLRAAITQQPSCFPALAQGEVTHFQTNRYFSTDGEEWPDDAWERSHPLYLDLVVVRDVVRDCTWPLPIKTLAMRPPPQRAVAYDRRDECHIGLWWDVFEKAEDAPWGESVSGARFPVRDAAGWDDVVMRGPRVPLMSRREWQAMSRFQPVGADWHKDVDPETPRWRRVVSVPGADTVVHKEMLPLAEKV